MLKLFKELFFKPKPFTHIEEGIASDVAQHAADATLEWTKPKLFSVQGQIIQVSVNKGHVDISGDSTRILSNIRNLLRREHHVEAIGRNREIRCLRVPRQHRQIIKMTTIGIE